MVYPNITVKCFTLKKVPIAGTFYFAKYILLS
jgi:hypothetical protein